MPALRTRDTQPRCLCSSLIDCPHRITDTHLPPATLEVSTDAPQAPTFAIISPTPRAFTFPSTHNLIDSPYSSPSHSPFEPDLRSLALSSNTPPPFLRTLTPDSSFTSVSPSPSSHKRRKSSCSSDIVERRPKKGDEDYIKRPENAFILFRRKCCEDRQAAQEDATADGPAKKQRQADLSKTISQQWKSLSTEERQYWEQLAKEKKKEHEALYPNYVYRPQRAKDKDGRSKSRKPKGRRGSEFEETDSDGLSFVVPVVAPHHRHHGRSASAPTPPPYQSIQVPNVYQMTPSCPTSPSLLPMISRRSSHPDHNDGMSFDFQPSNNYGQPSAFGRLEASLQSSEFLQSMFSMAGLETTRESLHPLDVSPAMLLPAHQIVSPASSVGTSSSGPSSPYDGPYTPHTGVLPHGFSQSGDESYPEPSQDEIDLQMEMQLQQEYAQFSWQTADAWQGHSELLGNDFDLNAIPPIELGRSKCLDSMQVLGNETEYGSQGQCGQEFSSMESNHFTEQGILAFDQMMAGHGF
ncbi:hypothetical protein H0H87_006388 [Tephrocybe sp. NHM501043]|nr:hypothetical protein H0H87_006388 [Tephrocybe sp. NHM501043]